MRGGLDQGGLRGIVLIDMGRPRLKVGVNTPGMGLWASKEKAG